MPIVFLAEVEEDRATMAGFSLAKEPFAALAVARNVHGNRAQVCPRNPDRMRPAIWPAGGHAG
jgi:hypothetical protein